VRTHCYVTGQTPGGNIKVRQGDIVVRMRKNARKRRLSEEMQGVED
jgi:hypothetical protein